MKVLITVLTVTLLAACSDYDIQHFVFKKIMNESLLEMCDGDEACNVAVEEQIDACMEEADWLTYTNSNDDDKELIRFMTEFYPCFKGPDGEAYWAHIDWAAALADQNEAEKLSK